jgi:hypothetical protein
MREEKPVHIIMAVPFCMHFNHECCDARVHPIGGAVVYAIPQLVMWSQCTSLRWCLCVCISEVRDVKPVYILKVVPSCIHFRRAGCEASIYLYGDAVLYAFPEFVMWSLCTSLCKWRCVCIPTLRGVKPVYILIHCVIFSTEHDVMSVYILMVVPLWMHFHLGWSQCTTLCLYRVLMSLFELFRRAWCYAVNIIMVVPLVCIFLVRYVTPVNIFMDMSMCMHFCLVWCEARLHPYGFPGV